MFPKFWTLNFKLCQLLNFQLLVKIVMKRNSCDSSVKWFSLFIFHFFNTSNFDFDYSGFPNLEILSISIVCLILLLPVLHFLFVSHSVFLLCFFTPNVHWFSPSFSLYLFLFSTNFRLICKMHSNYLSNLKLHVSGKVELRIIILFP